MAHLWGANSYAWMWSLTARDCMARQLALGFDEVELMAMPGHFWPGELSANHRRALRDWMSGAGMTLRSINHPGVDQNLASPVPGMRRYSAGVFEALIQLAADVGCPVVVVVTGRINPLLPAPMSRHREWVVEAIRGLLPMAEDLGIHLALENIPIGPAALADDLVEMVQCLESPSARICYDVANAHFAGEDPVAGLTKVAPWLDLLHLSDTTRERWRHDPVGEGDVDFAAVLQAAHAQGHARKPLLELCVPDPEPAHRISVERLARLAG